MQPTNISYVLSTIMIRTAGMKSVCGLRQDKASV